LRSGSRRLADREHPDDHDLLEHRRQVLGVRKRSDLNEKNAIASTRAMSGLTVGAVSARVVNSSTLGRRFGRSAVSVSVVVTGGSEGDRGDPRL
jgi:hypothetical protein